MDTEENAYCRLCADFKQCSDLSNLELELNAAKRRDIVNQLLRFHIPVDFNNTLPKTVCFKCINSLETAFDFLTTVEQAQEAFNTEYSLFYEEKRAELHSDFGKVSNENDSVIKSSVSDSDASDTEFENSKPGKDSNSKSVTKKCLSKPKNEFDPWHDVTWLCGYCKTLCSTVDRIKIHLMQFHSTCNVYTCTECKQKEYNLDKFISHICKHKPFLELTCHRCLEECSSLREMKKHKLTHLSSKYFCNGCNTSFSNPEELEAHKNSFYKDKTAENSVPVINSTSLTCVICQKTLKTKVLLSRHLHIHTERKRNHTCDVCGKGFYHNRILQQHSVVHTDKRPFKCEICKFAYKLKSELKKHVAMHFEPKSFKCTKCGRHFRQLKELKRHEIIHTNLRPHQCTFCKKDFRFQHLLKQHIRLHTGVKPYSCDICSKTFTNWSNYNKHMKEVHGIDKAKRKKTKDGVYNLDQTTGKVIYPDKEKMMDWKNKMLKTEKKGRPKKTQNGRDRKSERALKK